MTQRIIRDMEVVALFFWNFRIQDSKFNPFPTGFYGLVLRFVNTQPFHHNVIGQLGFFSRIYSRLFGGKGRLFRFLCFVRLSNKVFLFQMPADYRNWFDPENRKACRLHKGNILEINCLGFIVDSVYQKSAAIHFKSSFSRNQALMGIFGIA